MVELTIRANAAAATPGLSSTVLCTFHELALLLHHYFKYSVVYSHWAGLFLQASGNQMGEDGHLRLRGFRAGFEDVHSAPEFLWKLQRVT